MDTKVTFVKVQQIQIRSRKLDKLCFIAKNLYNEANYLVRQEFIKTSKMKSEGLISNAIWLRYYDLDKLLKKSENYIKLGSNCGQEILRLVEKNWKSFFEANKSYQKSPNKFTGRPKLPGYKDREVGRFLLCYAGIHIQYKNGKLRLPKTDILIPCALDKKSIKQVRVIPRLEHQMIEIVYEIPKIDNLLDPKKKLSIDLGLNNMISATDHSGNSFILNGKSLKSINQFFNKTKAKIQSILELHNKKKSSKRLNSLSLKRSNRIKNYLHHYSKFIIQYCIKNQIQTIAIGYNKQWKTSINLGRRTNQNFVNIPFKTLIDQIQYKAALNGINVKLHEESYTSKCDSLALEKLGKHETYLGKRVKRGLFQSSLKKVINADINAAINIGRKVFGDSFAREIIDRGLCFRPTLYRNIECLSEMRV